MTPTEHHDKWQKHVITALWLLFFLGVAVAAVFAWAGANGLPEWLTVHKIPPLPVPSWPSGWP
jgi:hypothetical protein